MYIATFQKWCEKFWNILEQIESCHNCNQKKLLYNIKTSTRKDFEQAIRVKKDQKYLNRTDLDFPEGTCLFINHSLCLYYRNFETIYLSIYLSVYLSIYLYYMYILILFVLCILSLVYIYIYICNILNNKILPRPLVISK